MHHSYIHTHPVTHYIYVQTCTYIRTHMYHSYPCTYIWYIHTHPVTHYIYVQTCTYIHATHCSTLQHATTYCNTHRARPWAACGNPAQPHTLRHTATFCNTLQHTAAHYNTHRAHEWAACGNPAQPHTTHNAIHCNTLQHTATLFNALQHTQSTSMSCVRQSCATTYTATHCGPLQHTATHCNTLQHTATHCNTLQHTATHYNTHRARPWAACGNPARTHSEEPTTPCRDSTWLAKFLKSQLAAQSTV